ncbi:hypothetical protein [Alteromonas sediminis]|nr:hypothetical protein [Alteromonas sediminis]
MDLERYFLEMGDTHNTEHLDMIAARASAIEALALAREQLLEQHESE